MAKLTRNIAETNTSASSVAECVGPMTCPALAYARIYWIGWTHADTDFLVTRPHPKQSVLLLVTRGRAMFFAGGVWRLMPAGTAAICPAGVAHGFASDRGTTHDLCAIMFDEPPGQPRMIDEPGPRLVYADPNPLDWLIHVLCRENAQEKETLALKALIDLIRDYANRIINPRAAVPRLKWLWSIVRGRPDAAWSLATLAREASVSPNTLRNLCRKEVGRSPMQHVTALRMEIAAQLVTHADATVWQTAAAVGYDDVAAFSRAFRRWNGRAPKPFQLSATMRGSKEKDNGDRNDPIKAPASPNQAVPAFTAPVTGSSWITWPLNAYFQRGSNDEAGLFGDGYFPTLWEGHRVLHGVPLSLPRRSARINVVQLRSERVWSKQSGEDLPRTIRITIGRRVQKIYFLHAMGFAGDQKQDMLESISFHFEESHLRLPVLSANSANADHRSRLHSMDPIVQDWWDQTVLVNASVRPVAVPVVSRIRTAPVHLSLWEWTCPKPDFTVTHVELKNTARCRSCYALFAMTLLASE